MRLGSYEVIKELGRGGMGVVYVARHQVLGSQSVIKLLLPEWTQNTEIVQRFVNEARAAAALRHRNIVRVHDCAQAPDGQWYIVLEFLEGGPLSRFIHSNGGPIDAARTVLILGQAANALQTAHDAGIVHRDVKPDNIFLTQQDGNDHHVVLLDFGIAKLGEGRAGAKTRTGVGMGTPSYMAPEQLANAKDVDPRSDVYALGVIAFEMLTGGYLPWGQDTAPVEIYRRQTSEAPPDVRTCFAGVSPELAAVVTRAMQCDPRHRWASAREFALALAEATPADGFAPAGSEILRDHARELLELGASDSTFGHRVGGGSSSPTPAWMKSRPSGPASAGSGPVPGHLSPAYVTGQPAAATPVMRPLAVAVPSAGGPAPAGGWTPPPSAVPAAVTTLGGSAAQSMPPPARRSRTPLIAALGIAGAGGAVAVALALGGDKGGSAAGASSDATPAAIDANEAMPGGAVDVDAAEPQPIDAAVPSDAPIEVDAGTDARRDGAIDAGRRRPGGHGGNRGSASGSGSGSGSGSSPAFDPDNVGGD